MSQAKKAIVHGESFQDAGTVVRVEGEVVCVRLDGRELTARRAASCLLDPEVDDLVLVAGVPRVGAYVLAVLERADRTPRRITLAGDTQWVVADGRLSLAADRGVDLVSREVTVAAGEQFELTAGRASVGVRALVLSSGEAVAEVGRAELVAETCELVAERSVERVARSYRHAEEFDQVRAGRLDYLARGTLSLRAETTLMSAKDLVKVDAAQVHLG